MKRAEFAQPTNPTTQEIITMKLSSLPFTVDLPDGTAINKVGQSGQAAYTVGYENVGLSAAYTEISETYGYAYVNGAGK